MIEDVVVVVQEYAVMHVQEDALALVKVDVKVAEANVVLLA